MIWIYRNNIYIYISVVVYELKQPVCCWTGWCSNSTSMQEVPGYWLLWLVFFMDCWVPWDKWLGLWKAITASESSVTSHSPVTMLFDSVYFLIVTASLNNSQRKYSAPFSQWGAHSRSYRTVSLCQQKYLRSRWHHPSPKPLRENNVKDHRPYFQEREKSINLK